MTIAFQEFSPRNLIHYDDSKVEILLWDQWLAMLREIRKLGRVLVSSRNSHAIVGEFRQFSELISDSEELNAMDLEQVFSFDFAAWHHALAWSEARPFGRMLKIEVSNEEGLPFFRISLTPDSDKECFWELVQAHQGWASHWEPSQLPEDLYVGKRALMPCYSKLHRDLSMERFWNLLDEMRFAQAQIEIQALGAGSTQKTRFSLMEIHAANDWIFLGGSTGCAHLMIQELSSMRWSGPHGENFGAWEI